MIRIIALILLTTFPFLAHAKPNELFENPPSLSPKTRALAVDEWKRQVGEDVWNQASIESRQNLGSAGQLLPVDGIRDIEKSFKVNALSRYYATEKLPASLDKTSKPVSLDAVWQLLFSRLKAEIAQSADPSASEKKLQEITDGYLTFLNRYADLVSKLYQFGRDDLTELAEISKVDAQTDSKTLYAKMAAVQDAMQSAVSIEEREKWLDDNSSPYAHLPEKDQYRFVLERQKQFTHTLDEEADVRASLEDAVSLAQEYDAITEYEVAESRKFIELIGQTFAVGAGAMDKNPFAVISAASDLTLNVYDELNGGSPEEQRHNEVRRRLAALAEGQQLILKELRDLQVSVQASFARVYKKLDTIQYLVTASQRLIIDQGLEGLRDCEKFSEGRQYYSDNSFYPDYTSMKAHFSNREMNRYYHSCFNFLNDVSFQPEGLSILNVSSDVAQAEALAAELGQDTKWLEKQLGNHKNSMTQLRDLVARFVDPNFQPAFYGALTLPSQTSVEIDEKLAEVANNSDSWKKQYQILNLSVNLRQFYNPYTIVKMSEAVTFIQEHRLLANEQGDDLRGIDELLQPSFRPLNISHGSTPEKQFDHFTALNIQMQKLVRISQAQQNLYSGDLLIPFIANTGLSTMFQYWIKKSGSLRKHAENLMKVNLSALATSSILRENVVRYKLNRRIEHRDLPLFEEFIKAHPPLPNETEKEWEERVVKLANDLYLKPYKRVIDSVKNLSKISRTPYKDVLSAYAEFLEKQYMQTSLHRIGSRFAIGQRLYKKYSAMDIMTGRGAEAVNESYLKKWVDPQEIRSFFGSYLDIDFINLTSDLGLRVLAHKEDPNYGWIDIRDGSHLDYPIPTVYAKKIKDQKRKFTKMPGYEIVKKGQIKTSGFHRSLKAASDSLRIAYLQRYMSLWVDEEWSKRARWYWLDSL